VGHARAARLRRGRDDRLGAHAPWRTYSHSGRPPVGFHGSRRVNQSHHPSSDIAP